MGSPICEDSYDYENAVCEPVTARSCTPLVGLLTADDVPASPNTLKSGLGSFADAVWSDFALTNRHIGGKVAKFGAGLVVGGKVAGEFGAVTPLKWALRGFGPLPAEFTSSGAIQVFRYTTTQRALLVGKAAAAKFLFVTIAFEGGVLVGAVVNQAIPEETKMMIGGTINEIVNEGGWKLLFKHPFGIGM